MGRQAALHVLRAERPHHGLPQQVGPARARRAQRSRRAVALPALEAVDNILDMRYFEDRPADARGMRLPGPTVLRAEGQPRSATMLRRCGAAQRPAHPAWHRKPQRSCAEADAQGHDGLHNVQLLKWCREYGIAVDWNLLYGFPGETDADYEAITAMLPRIRHLQLPGACGPIRLDRFSPYFVRPRSLASPMCGRCRSIAFSIRSRACEHERVAYYFHFDYAPGVRASPAAHAAVRLAEALRDSADEGSLRALPHRDGGLHLADTRAQAKIAALRLSAFERCIVMRIDEVASVAQVMQSLAHTFPAKRFADDDVRAFLDELVGLDMALTDDKDNYLGLALMPSGLRPELEASSRRVPAPGSRCRFSRQQPSRPPRLSMPETHRIAAQVVISTPGVDAHTVTARNVRGRLPDPNSPSAW